MTSSKLLKLRSRVAREVRFRGAAGRRDREALVERDRFYEDAWREAAHAVGASLRPIGAGCFEIARASAVTRVSRQTTALDDPVTASIAADKPLVHKILSAVHLPTPQFAEFRLDDLGPAFDFLRTHALGVVKPAWASHSGLGVTTQVKGRRRLIRAAIHAAGFGRQLLIESQIEGHVVRLLFLRGHLLDAVHRRAPAVIGDGSSTVARLMAAQNRERGAGGYRKAQTFLRRDADMEHTLATQGLRWRSVPADGRRVRLKTVVNDNSAQENVSVAGMLHPETIELGRRAAAAVGVRLAGVDVVVPALDAPARAVVLEVNTPPGYYYHYHTLGEPVRVAVPILRACLDRALALDRVGEDGE